MIKIKFWMMALALVLDSGLCMADDVTVKANELPLKAQSFIAKKFPGKKIVRAEKDSEVLRTTYEVLLNNGAELEFGSKGAWKRIKCKPNAVPESTVPAAIGKYVRQKFPQAKIVEIEIDYGRYEIELSNGTEIKFNKQFKVVNIDR